MTGALPVRRLLSFLKPAPRPAGAAGSTAAAARVGFLVAGVQKGGTTTLARHLADHPAIGLARRKEVHFFDDEKRDWTAPMAADYHQAFRFAAGCRLHGECTPAYVFWDPAHDRIRAYNPAMRFVLVFRDPIDRAFSHWSMEYARGNEKKPFAEAIRAGRRRVKADRWNGNRRVFSYVERGFYGHQVERLLARFPRRQLLCLPSEQLFADPGAALAEIARFLEVPPFPAATREIHAKKAPAVDYPSRLTRVDAAHLADLYRDDVALFGRLTGFDTGRWLDAGKYVD